jgi:hypothetical protein
MKMDSNRSRKTEMSKQKIRSEAVNICTTGGWLEEGAKYTYREGGHRFPVILEEILENAEFLRLQIFAPEIERRFVVDHRNDFKGGYMGMWRLCDYHEEDYLPDEDEEDDLPDTESVFQPEFTSDKYIRSLSYEQLGGIKAHFQQLNGIDRMGEKEYRLTYLAWLIGANLLDVGDNLIIWDMARVDFDEHEYSKDLEAHGISNIDIGKLVDIFKLDDLYRSVLISDGK